MGWKSAVTLVQAAVRNVVFDLVTVPRTTSLEKALPILEGDHLTVVYLDNFDKIRIIKRFSDTMAAERGEPTETHARFNQVCDEVGLPRNAAKQLIGAMCVGASKAVS